MIEKAKCLPSGNGRAILQPGETMDALNGKKYYIFLKRKMQLYGSVMAGMTPSKKSYENGRAPVQNFI